MDILLTPHCFNTSNFSFVILSGLPASTVNSFTVEKSQSSLILFMILSNCIAESVFGVPPPIYTVVRTLFLIIVHAYSISLINASI